jgi:hypothetical protein
MANVTKVELCKSVNLAQIPNGRWAGTWSGYEVVTVCGEHGKFLLTLDKGTRGCDVSCIVIANKGHVIVEKA